MSLSIRDYIRNNFKEANAVDIRNSIEASITSKEEETLPGIGVFFELLWENSNENMRRQIISGVQEGLTSSF